MKQFLFGGEQKTLGICQEAQQDLVEEKELL